MIEEQVQRVSWFEEQVATLDGEEADHVASSALNSYIILLHVGNALHTFYLKDQRTILTSLMFLATSVIEVPPGEDHQRYCKKVRNGVEVFTDQHALKAKMHSLRHTKHTQIANQVFLQQSNSVAEALMRLREN